WYVWADPNPDGTPPNNWLPVFGGPGWEWEPRRQQYYMHNFLASQPDLNMHNPDVQAALMDAMRFWLDRGVDGFRLDTVNYYFHDTELRDNPPRKRRDNSPINQPFDFQDHVFSKNRPENIAFLTRLREMTDAYDARMMVGEVGDSGDTGIRLMAEYTAGDHMLHMCYSFEMLGPDFTAAHFRRVIEGVRKGAPDGHSCWSFSNHDVPRHVTRWAQHGTGREALARQAVAMLMSFPGTIGIYQGEELGQTETVMEYHELTDAQAIRFWPEIKGRDGCRTPMVWDDSPNAGFTTGTPWLPIKPPQAANAVAGQGPGSVLAAYRDTIAFRRSQPCLGQGDISFLDLPEPLLAFHRSLNGQTVTCLFNLSPAPLALTLAGAAAPIGPRVGEVRGDRISLPGSGFLFLQSDGQSPELSIS
ncbi:MAG: alpha-amylase family glycosyl hydrolase, partial [Paracoccus sp. (in: a-proteobacteria)]|nr:alpha-amylase family glycosyl hydrolase [Paracoccus sp. (in: a-proteobacteria)]